MINNNCEAKHLGGGVVLFENAIDLNWQQLISYSDQSIQKEWSEMYKEAIDPETGKEVYVNRSGYFYGKESINSMPKRAGSIHSESESDFLTYLSFLEESRDFYLLKYFEIFPLAYKCVWWKVKGHILKYSKNVYLGSHSDTSADYIYGLDHPSDQLALRNTITALIYFNDCVDQEDELNGTNFVGGHHYFNYLDINYKPKKGDIIMFPSNYIAAHEVTKVTAGDRYSYLGWYSQGTPNPNVREYVADPSLDPDLSKKATNVYMPELRDNFRNYLKQKGHAEHSYAYQITKSNY